MLSIGREALITKKLVFLLCCLLSFTASATAANISLNINNGELRDVLHALAQISHKNIIMDESIQGKVTIELHDISWEKALDIIARSKGLTYQSQEDIIMVTAQEKLNDYWQNIGLYRLNYCSAQELQPTLQELFPKHKLVCDASNNLILFQGTSQEQSLLSNTLRQLDQPSKQVTLEARLLAINTDDAKNAGITWQWDKIPQKDKDSSSNQGQSGKEFGGNFNFWHGYTFKFNATLNALLAQGKAKLLATPSIITIPGREASIFIGDHLPVQTEKHDQSGSYTTTEYLDAGIKLTYTPIVSEDGKMVTANVHTEVSTPTLISEMLNYKITSRMATTNVRMLSGETLVIGGLINEEEQQSLQQIPLLSKIPLFGELFKNRTKRKAKTEVVMLLTPHVTEAGQAPTIYSNTLANISVQDNKASQAEAVNPAAVKQSQNVASSKAAAPQDQITNKKATV